MTEVYLKEDIFKAIDKERENLVREGRYMTEEILDRYFKKIIEKLPSISCEKESLDM